MAVYEPETSSGFDREGRSRFTFSFAAFVLIAAGIAVLLVGA